MPAICVIQARMSSSRLPGKVLADLGGIPLLSLLLRRIARARMIGDIVVVTSEQHDDDEIVRLCSDEGVTCQRGSLNDVASRFVTIATQKPHGCIVRICGDSPFSDPELIDEAVSYFSESGCDVLTTSSPRTTPHGMSVEVFSAEALLSAYPRFSSAEDFEHVTRYFYSHADSYRIATFSPEPVLPLGMRFAVDTLEDLGQARRIVDHLGDAVTGASCREIIKIAEEL